MKYFIQIWAFVFIGNFFLLGQSSGDCLVKLNVIKPLTAYLIENNLDFGEVFLSSQSSVVSKACENGAKFYISGHPNKIISISYNKTILSNAISAQELGLNTDYLEFDPVVVSTGRNISYSNPKKISSGSTEILENENGTGKLYIWVGGEISIDPTKEGGVYLGNFVISVDY